MTALLPRILLVEPQFVLRRTLVAVARDMGIAAFDEAVNLERARTLLLAEVYEGLVLDFQDPARALALLRDLRGGSFLTSAAAQVVVVAGAAQTHDRGQLHDLGVTDVLSRPFKISQLLETLGSLWIH